ncbi:MAG: 30S ribosomal protein S16 [Nitrospirota bacterium]
MAVRIRLSRIGRHKRPFYRIVVADSKMQREGRHLEIIGTYNPFAEPSVNIKSDRAISWLLKGAKASEPVNAIFRKRGINKEYRETKTKMKMTDS